MPRASSQETIRRQWRILRGLTNTPMTVREIHRSLDCDGYTVTRRTVERDLRDLSAHFNLVTSAGKPQGWAWNRSGARGGFVGMDPVEAFALATASEVLARMLPGVLLKRVSWLFEAAREHLPAGGRKGVVHWSALIRYLPIGNVLRSPVIDDKIMETVQDSLLQGRCLRASYRKSRHGKTTDFLLHPVALLLQGSTPYLLATLGRDGDEPFRYAIHRFRSAELGDDRSRRPQGFDLELFLAGGGDHFGAGGIFKLEAEVRGELAVLLSETPLSEDQKLVESGDHHRLTATVRDSWNLHFWILSQGANFTIRKPVRLRRLIRETLSNALVHYD